MQRAIYVLPYVSIVSEKAQYLSRLTENINFKIINWTNDSTPGKSAAVGRTSKSTRPFWTRITDNPFEIGGFQLLEIKN